MTLYPALSPFAKGTPFDSQATLEAGQTSHSHFPDKEIQPQGDHGEPRPQLLSCAAKLRSLFYNK